MKRKRIFALVIALAMVMALMGSVTFAAAEEEEAAAASETSSLEFDSTAWLYNESNDVYYQVGVVYCEDPYDTTYESFGIYVPAAYMEMEDNGDGTYTFVSFTDEVVNGFTAETAPIVIPVNTAGYSAQAAPTGYSSGTSTYTDEGFIYLYAGCRGRDTENGGAPWGATDLKAAIRYYRLNSDVLPGDTDSIFTFGHSGGGAQSAVMGASGDSELYYAYLYEIGAAGIEYDEATGTYTSTISDAIAGAMCWCPITNLDTADAGYEWMMGQYDTTSDSSRSEGTWTSLLSDDLAEAFAEYINNLSLVDEDGNALTLEESEDGIYAAGTYYDYLLYQIEYSLNDFIDSYTDEDGNFSYSSSSSGSTDGPGDISGDLPDGDLPSDSGPMSISESASLAVSSDESEELLEYLLSIDENYGTDEAWITYDEETGWYSVRSIEDFVLYGSKSASKSVGAFDDLDLGQAENNVFGAGSSGGAHFDSILSDLLSANYAVYAAADSSVSEDDILAYAEDYADDIANYTDSLGNSIEYRSNMYNPMYYVCEDYDGYGTSTVASYWRINTGITQSDTSITVETNLYLALQEAVGDGVVESVDFAMYWEQGHTAAERAGADSDECFIEWVVECLSEDASGSVEDDTDDDADDDADTTPDTDTDSDTDTDTDTDTEDDSDFDPTDIPSIGDGPGSDSDTDADTDSDTNKDADTDSDADSDADADKDTDEDADADVDTDADSGSGDTGSVEDELPSEPDEQAEAETEAEAEAETEAATEAETEAAAGEEVESEAEEDEETEAAETEEEDTEETDSDSTAAATGDTNNLVMWVIFGAAAVIAAAVLAVRRRLHN